MNRGGPLRRGAEHNRHLRQLAPTLSLIASASDALLGALPQAAAQMPFLLRSQRVAFKAL